MKRFLGLACALFLALSLTSAAAFAAKLTDGVFEGVGTGFGGDLKVAVTVTSFMPLTVAL